MKGEERVEEDEVGRIQEMMVGVERARQGGDRVGG